AAGPEPPGQGAKAMGGLRLHAHRAAAWRRKAKPCLLLLVALLWMGLLPRSMPAALAQSSGTKLLYAYDDQGLTRAPQATSNTSGLLIEGLHNTAVTEDWTLAPAIPAGESLVVSAGAISVKLMLQCVSGSDGSCLAWSSNRVFVQ